MGGAQLNWQEPDRQKVIGYVLRIAGLLIWGTDPIIAKYMLKRYNGFFISAFSVYIGAAFLVPFLVFRLWKNNPTTKNSQPSGYNRYFFLAVAFGGLTSLFHVFSLNFTIASNSVLFLNFAPVIALLVVLALYRHRIPYLSQRTEAVKIVVIFLIGCVGSSLLIVHSPVQPNVDYSRKLFGDALALLSLVFDVVATLALMHYAKLKEAFSGLDYVLRKTFFLTVLYAPFVVPQLFDLRPTFREWLAFLFLGVFTSVLGYYFAYEAYQRLDGLIVYLLFTLTPLFTIGLETALFGLQPSVTFVFGGVLILGAAIFAEIINSRAQKVAQPAASG